MELRDSKEQTGAICSPKKSPNCHISGYHMANGKPSSPAASFEIRLFYVRISPCIIDAVPNHLNLSHLRRRSNASLEINGSRIPAEETATVALRRDRIDREAFEVTYVSTDGVRVSGAVDFEVFDLEDLIICGSIEMVDEKTGWSLNCSVAGSNVFFQPNLGITSPSIEVYVAGCCSGVPSILSKTIQLSPRRRPPLAAIPEDEETDKIQGNGNSIFFRHQPVEERTHWQVPEGEIDGYESRGKLEHDLYLESSCSGENGELSWFNAGVRVGVGISLGMCLGIGIGVGLLMRSYQATTRTFRRRFL